MRGRKSNPVESMHGVVKFEDCPAKTYLRADGRIVVGRSVFNHCQIVGRVANELICRLPQWLQIQLYPEGTMLVASSHDIGKVTPTFYEKILSACCREILHLKLLGLQDFTVEKNWGGHAGVSQLTAEAIGAPNRVPKILGQHHGFSPTHQLGLSRSLDKKFGGKEWHEERVRLIEALKEDLNCDWPDITDAYQARVIAGLTTVADWIGSGEFFENPSDPWRENISKAVDKAGFLPINLKKNLSFEQIFGFEARESQQVLIDAVSAPGLYILEAPMGIGKTEAALYAAYKLLNLNLSTGIYFALPTQLTSNMIYERFKLFLDQVLEENSPHRSLLLHSAAWLVQTDMGEDAKPGGDWFSQSKRGLLAPFAVGTVDQALMSAMSIKHGAVRTFGLSGKVVILDEIHTYDSYTGTILNQLIEQLSNIGATVIVLTATLSHAKRQELFKGDLSSSCYPLITAQSADGELKEHALKPDSESNYRVVLQNDLNGAIEQALERAANGEHVLWIENTVGEAQERYLDIAANAGNLGVDCGLLHSRFTLHDRQQIERQWVGRFGKSGWSERLAKGRILIGTQVLEQSLDIDADFLVSRIAPSDMLIQRIGRLWRHKQTPRPASAKKEVLILTPDLDSALTNAESAFGGTAYVYSPYVLLRTLEVWCSLDSLVLPTDIRPLIEKTYSKRQEMGALSDWLHRLEEGDRVRTGEHTLKQKAKLSFAHDGQELCDNNPPTRYIETPSRNALLIRSLNLDTKGGLSQLELLNGEKVTLPLFKNRLSKEDWRRLSAKLSAHIVAVPLSYKLPISSISSLKQHGFGNCFYIGAPDGSKAAMDVCVTKVHNILNNIDNKGDTEVKLVYNDQTGLRKIK